MAGGLFKDFRMWTRYLYGCSWLKTAKVNDILARQSSQVTSGMKKGIAVQIDNQLHSGIRAESYAWSGCLTPQWRPV